MATIQEKYENYMRIFTDGSKYEESTTAAVWIPENNHQDSWKIEEATISIMGAEFFAITKAAEWVVLNGEFLEKKEVVMLTDSLSTLETLEHWRNTKYQTAVNRMIGLAELLKDRDFNLTLQWIPSHVGVDGNEKADQLAKEAHLKNTTTHCPLSPEDVKRKVRAAQEKAWQLKYETTIQDLHIGTIKPKVGHWPWASHTIRAAETALARLRISHVELNDYLHRFGQAESPLCQTCRSPETVDHYLIHCRRYS